MELRPYQIEAKDAILKEWEDKQRTLLVLPTGCGKTVVFADVAKDRARIGRVLILAHREELLTQASDKIGRFCGLSCAVEKAEKTSIGSDDHGGICADLNVRKKTLKISAGFLPHSHSR